MSDTSYLYGDGSAGAPPRAPRPGPRQRGPRGGRGRGPGIGRGLVILLVAALVLGLAGTAAYVATRPAETPTVAAASAGPLVQAPVAPQRAACLDRSGSVDNNGRIGTRTARVLQQAVERRDLGADPVPRTSAVPPVAEQRLVVRVVRANSFTTDDGDLYSVDTTIPGVPGLAAGQPYDDGSEGFVTKLDAWDTAYADVTKARTAAGKKQEQAAEDLTALGRRHSNGSDVYGCLAAVLSLLDDDQPREVLLVSDLADRGPGVATIPGSMKNSFQGAHLTVVLACPQGLATTCEQRLSDFTTAVVDLGMDPDVNVLRAETVDTAVRDWLWKD